MTPAQLHFHEQHKQRIARINQRAYSPPVLEVIAAAEPCPPQVVAEPESQPKWYLTHDQAQRSPSVREIQDALSAFFGCSREDMISDRRDWPYVLYRQVGFLLCRELTKINGRPISTIRIGRYFGGRDHTTVIYGIWKAQQLIEENQQLREGYQAVKSHFGASDATP